MKIPQLLHGRIGEELKAGQIGMGYWKTEVATAGGYEIVLRFSEPVAEESAASLQINERIFEDLVTAGRDQIVFDDVSLAKGNTDIKGWVKSGCDIYAVRYVVIRKK